jgi:peptidoglycan/xylan/chitin deacetylase (PgdA/CDA1 family)
VAGFDRAIPMTPPAVSVIIPAHNAATTLAGTVASLQGQTWREWEAIIVENGSSDQTAAVAASCCAGDPRLRWCSRPTGGVSAARNAGLAQARHDWVLFLDADDWLRPSHLERLTAHLAAHPELDAVHCGWARVDADQHVLWEELGPAEEDLYPRLARTCAFAIHACVARRALIQEVGGFDPSLRTGEDWDLWLRLARAGARFGHVPVALALYRARAGSASMNPRQLLADSLEVLRRAYGPDPRVAHPVSRYAQGIDRALWPEARLQNVLWAGGLVMGQGGDAVPLLQDLRATDIVFDPSLYASCLHSAITTVRLGPLERCIEWHRELEPQFQRFLSHLETLADRPGLSRAAMRQLERLTLDRIAIGEPITLGATHALGVELTEPLPTIAPDPEVERICCRVSWKGEAIGRLDLPVIDGLVPAAVLADAIAAEFAWPVLGRFFAESLYPQLQRERDDTGWTLRREGRTLASSLPGGSAPDWSAVHDRIGWTVFLQEIWGQPAAAEAEFYWLAPAERARFAAAEAEPDGAWLPIELSDPKGDRVLWRRRTRLLLTVGGVPIVEKSIAHRGRVRAATLRAAFTLEAGFELCRAVVREALIGHGGTGTLRERLAARVRERADGSTLTLAITSARLAPASARSLPALLGDIPGPLVLWPRRRAAAAGTPQTQRGLLPHSLLPDLEQLCRSSQEPCWHQPAADGSGGPPRLLHVPEMFWQPTSATGTDAPSAPAADGEFFEGLFAASADPWRYDSAYEKTKYEQTLALLPSRRFRRALELACAEGHFTAQLAPRVDQLLATDVSGTALARTRERCQAHPHVQYERLDLLRDRLPGRFDLIVCSEVLYYAGTRPALAAAARKLAGALRPGGLLVTAHAHAVVDEPDRPGFDWEVPFGGKVIGETLAATPGLRLDRELQTPLYRIQVFERHQRWKRWRPSPPPQRTLLSRQPTPLEPEVEAHVLWQGRSAGGPPQTTSTLPILMYHRVATDGPAGLARYRVSPDDFEAQLAHLRSAGYTSVTFEEWRQAMATKHPLPGRRVLLTFDDGYRDFLVEAWPRLKRYGFSATVFLPTAHIGGTSSWDQAWGEPAPLLDWSEIFALDREGVQFGAHTVTHSPLTSLTPTAAAAELLRCRTVLQENLGERVVSLAYPFGDHDAVIRTIAASCGYLYGVSCENRAAGFYENLLALPRREVRGDLTLDQFRLLLGETCDLPPPRLAAVETPRFQASASLRSAPN